jgi:hypothetical protein
MIKTFLSFPLILLLFLSTLAYTVYRLESPTFLSGQAREVNLYGRLSNQLEGVMPKEISEGLPLSKSDIADVIRSSIDGPIFYDFLDKFLTSELDWLTGRTDQLAFSYSLAAVKHKAQDALAAKLTAQYSSLPACKPTELKNWENDQGIPTCKLPETKVASRDINRVMVAGATKSLADIPDTVTISGDGQAKARTKIIMVLKGVTIVWAVTALFLALYIIILRRRAFWPLAGIFLVVGLLQIGFSLIAWDWLARTISDSLNGKIDGSILPLVIDLIGATLEVFKTILGNLSIFFLVSGGALLVLAVINKIRKPVSV